MGEAMIEASRIGLMGEAATERNVRDLVRALKIILA